MNATDTLARPYNAAQSNSKSATPVAGWKRHKLLLILGLLVAVLIVVRILLPGIFLKKINAELATASPLYSLHIDKLDLHIWRMAYSFRGVDGKLKENGYPFINIPKVNIAIAWRELIRGRFVADVDIHEAKIKLTTATINAVSGYDPKQAKTEAKDIKQSTVPFDLERLRSFDSSFEFGDVAGLPPEQKFRLTHINLVANNLTPKHPEALTLATFSGAIQETGKIKGVAQIRQKSEPAEWSLNLEMRNFELPKLNGVASRTVPISFKSGELSLFMAAQSVKGKLNGYVKPFLKDVVFIGDKKDFKTIGQFFYEIVGTVGNFFLKNSKTHTLATKITFKTVNGKVETDTGKALGVAVKNASGNGLTQNLDETLGID